MPTRLVYDQGKAFTSKDFNNICRDNNIKQVLTPFRTPRANGHVERANLIIISMVWPTFDDDKLWDYMLRYIQWSINTMHNQTTGCTHKHLFYGFKPGDILQNKLIRA